MKYMPADCKIQKLLIKKIIFVHFLAPKEAESEPEPTCEYKGNVYKDGAAFYPNDEPCKKCICSPGFNGKDL